MENNQKQELISVSAVDNDSADNSMTMKANPKVSVDFAQNFGGKFNDEGFGVDVDKDGNIYVTGSFQDSATFGEIELESKGSSDAFVTKLDKTGKVLWAKRLGGTSFDEAYAIKVDKAGNAFVTGGFRNTVVFGTPEETDTPDIRQETDALNMAVAEKVSENPPLMLDANLEEIENPAASNFTFTSKGVSDGFLTKLDSTGKVQWTKQFSGEDSVSGEEITLDSNGNIYVTGNFKTEATFGEFKLNGNGSNDGFVTKLDESGKPIWASKFGGDSFDSANSIAVDEKGNTYITGVFESSAAFGNLTLNGGNSRDIFVAKLDDAGTFKWAKNFGGTAADKGNGITVDKLGNTYITGNFVGTATFGDTTLKSNGLSDGFITKLDAQGNVKWAKKFGGKSKEESFAVSIDESENIYLTGSFEDSISFGDTTLISPAIDNKDAFIAKLDKMGMVKWAKKLGSNSFDEGYDIVVKGDSEAYFSGSFLDNASIDNTNLNNAGKSDAFVVKLVEEIPEISLDVTPANISEDGDDKLTYTFTRTENTENPLTVNFMVGGDAVFNEDYTQTGADSFNATEGMITFNGGEETATITIDAKDDNVREKDETINLTLVAAKYSDEDKQKDDEVIDDKEILEKQPQETARQAEEEIEPEDVGKLMQSTVNDYKIATVSAVMATITNDDTTTDSGGNPGGGNSGGGNSGGGNPGSGNSGGGNSGGGNPGGVGKNPATKISKTDKTFALNGDVANVKFLLKKSSAGSVNEIALFKVDDEQGTINGISPDDDNYTEVASQNATTVFSVLKNPPKGLKTDLSRIIELDNGKFFRLLMVNNGTLDGLRKGSINLSQVRLSNSLTVSDIGDSNFDLGFSEDADNDEEITVQMQLDNQAVKPIGTNLQNQQQGEVLDLRSITSKQTVTFTVNREAEYNNFIGFYKVADENGGIDTDNDGIADVLTQADNYAITAINNRVAGIDLTVANEGTVEIQGEFEPGSIFAPFLIVNGTPDQLLDSDTFNDPDIFFPYIDANSDGVDHARMLGDNVFGFEDLPGGGDKDFNDITVSVEFG
ncbi:MAG: SBBP repeat-containing protein [Rivularia sp. (in: Bacteria)]|nr:SBBP repeat-containing protein [Rivularia sp. MS3]